MSLWLHFSHEEIRREHFNSESYQDFKFPMLTTLRYRDAVYLEQLRRTCLSSSPSTIPFPSMSPEELLESPFSDGSRKRSRPPSPNTFMRALFGSPLTDSLSKRKRSPSPPRSPNTLTGKSTPEFEGALLELSTIQGIKQFASYKFHLSVRSEYESTAKHIWVEIYDSDKDTFTGRKPEDLIGVFSGFLLSRPSTSFLSTLEYIDERHASFVSFFCDSIGRANQIKHPLLKGSAVMSGGLLYITEVEIKPSHQGKDLGLQIIQEVLVYLRNQWTLAVLSPSLLASHECRWHGNVVRRRQNRFQSDTEFDAVLDKVARHFARLGFIQAYRTVAWFLTSEWFFSREDFRTYMSKYDTNLLEVRRLRKTNSRINDVKLYNYIANLKKFPLSMSDISFIHGLLDDKTTLNGAYALNAAALAGADRFTIDFLIKEGCDINCSDDLGNRPIHEAAFAISSSLPILIEKGADINARNLNNATPLDELVRALLSKQADRMTMTFTPDEERPTLADALNLKNALIALVPAEQRENFIDEWMAPRVHKMLLISAKHASKKTSQGKNSETPVVFGTGIADLGYVEFIGPDTIKDMDARREKGYAKGWSQVFEAIENLLQDKKMPTVKRVREAIVGSNAFLLVGGKVEYALDALFIATTSVLIKRETELWDFEAFKNEIEALPQTPYDEVFDIVKAFCLCDGAELVSCGPYSETMAIIREM